MIEALANSLDKLEGPEAYASYTVAPYTLFGKEVPDYVTATREGEAGPRYLAYCHSSAPDACLWPLSPEDRPPGHGMMVAYNLTGIRPATALDLGCGRLLFLGRLVSHLGAKQVVGVDLAPPARNSDLLAREGLEYVQTDMLGGGLAGHLPRDRFELVVTHPPMMPAPEGTTHTDHDFAGPTGREVLDAVIARAPGLLDAGGRLVLGQFAFLGLEHPTGTPGCTADRLAEAGLAIDEVHTYRVPASQAIIDAQERIRQLYPDYAFEETGGRVYHHFSVVNARAS